MFSLDSVIDCFYTSAYVSVELFFSVLQTKDYTNKSLDADCSTLEWVGVFFILLSEGMPNFPSLTDGKHKNIGARFIDVFISFSVLKPHRVHQLLLFLQV